MAIDKKKSDWLHLKRGKATMEQEFEQPLPCVACSHAHETAYKYKIDWRSHVLFFL
jgi:hypothetical protein